MALFNALFCEHGLSPEYKTLIYDQDDDGAALGEDGFLMLSWWCLVRCYKEQITVAGLFFFVILLYFCWLCASILSLGHCIVVEAGCNWYRCDIKIFYLLKKI
jgi:hypothetical protein